MNYLKSDHDITEIHHNIRQDCFKYHRNMITDHYQQITSGKVIEHDGHKFDCPIKYLEHWKSNVDHSLIPIQSITRELDHHIEQRLAQQMEHQHEHDDLELDHGYSRGHGRGGHGMDL
jgi:hypothetical protein